MPDKKLQGAHGFAQRSERAGTLGPGDSSVTKPVLPTPGPSEDAPIARPSPPAPPSRSVDAAPLWPNLGFRNISRGTKGG